MRGFQLTISTILILVVLLVTTVIVLFFFTNVFGTSGVNIANIAGALNDPTGELGGGEDLPPGELECTSGWANPFDSREGCEP